MARKYFWALAPEVLRMDFSAGCSAVPLGSSQVAENPRCATIRVRARPSAEGSVLVGSANPFPIVEESSVRIEEQIPHFTRDDQMKSS